MRCVRQAESVLDDASAAETPTVEKAILRLRTAERAMRDMADVLSRAMAGRASGVELLRSYRTLGEDAERVVDSLAPLAEQHHVDMTLNVAEDARGVPAGALGPVILNGMQNAVRACADPGLPIRRVEMSISVDAKTSEVILLISDSGSGLSEPNGTDHVAKPHGHGLGLGVCADIVAELSGSLELTNIPFSGGAIMQVRVPIRSLGDE